MTGKEFAKKVRAWRPAGLWRHHDFVRLWTAAGISAAGTQVTLLALPLTAILVLHASAFEVAALATAATVPNLALGIAAGIWLDRVQRRPVMVAADFGRAVVLASVPVAYVFGVLSLPQLYLVALIGGSLNVLFDIASGAYLPSVVPRVQLVEANAKLQAAIVVAQAAGPSIGGALVTLLSAPMAIVVDAASFLISGSLIASANARDQVQREPQPKMTSLRTELRQAARYLLSDPYLRPLLVGHALANLALGLLWAIVIVYAVRVLGLMPGTLGVVLSLGQVGGVIGAAFAHRIAQRAGVGRVVVASFFLFGPATLLMATATGQTAIVFVTVGWTLESLARSLYGVSATSVRQALVPDRLQGRVIGLTTTAGTGAFPLGTLLGGALAGAFGLREAMFFAASVAVLPFIAVAASPIRTLRDSWTANS
ncbi:MAG: MFS transporter [Chloroflexi bacterium]|nr:MAG: MFS transporter [Chloroflexota bacterium]